jgi:hypothetical protein
VKKNPIFIFHERKKQEEDTPQIAQAIISKINHVLVLFNLRGKADVQNVQSCA